MGTIFNTFFKDKVFFDLRNILSKLLSQDITFHMEFMEMLRT